MIKKNLVLASAIAAATSASVQAACPAGTQAPSASIIGNPAFEECAIISPVTSNLTLTADRLWVLEGKTEVGIDGGLDGTSGTSATLTIEAGAIIVGDDSTVNANTSFTGDDGVVVNTPAPDYLIITRGSKISANGTAAAPITMTSKQGLLGSGDSGQWGGLYINGYGLNNGCKDAYAPSAPTGTCERSGEAATGTHGGGDNTDDSGNLDYVTVAYAGGVYSPESDLNGIAFQSVGSGTTVNNIQVHANVDDGVEFYGGAVSVNNVVLTDNGDDSFDTTEGWQGTANNVLIYQSDGSGSDRAFESDNNKKAVNNASLPLTNGTVSNVTIISGDNTADLLKIRRGSALNLVDVAIYNTAGTCFNIDDGDGNGNAAEAGLVNVSYDCSVVTDKQAAIDWMATAGNSTTAYLSSFNGYINGYWENEAGVGAVTSCANDWTAPAGNSWVVAGTLPAADCTGEGVNVPVMGWAGLAALFAGLVGITRMSRRIK
ncbi:MAG: hypothetical protein CL691_07845 [Cellvibrionales bacterium]|nr:hypothetical protein [Cellvibrionales bacterium]|tara:strand:+ start:2602 stop:4065 length:1464 start_codon:yes stop_codon:yes gene_type:complete